MLKRKEHFALDRALRACDHGVQPSIRDREREAGEDSARRERRDPRRGNTAHVRALAAEIERRRLEGTLYEPGCDPDEQDGGSEDNPSETIDSGTERCLNVVLVDEKEEDVSAATMSKPVKHKAPRKVFKSLASLKKHLKTKKSAKKGKKKVLEQTCINLSIPVKVKLDAWCKKNGKSRNRLLNELAAKFVGVKLPAKAAS